MLVDTGASDTVLSDWFVKEHSIPLLADQGKGIDSGAHRIVIKFADVDSIELGKAHYKLGKIIVIPSPAAFKSLGIGGILSPQSVFEGKSFTLDFPRSQIVFGDEASTRTGEKISAIACSGKNKYMVSARINGASGHFYLDTGGKGAAVTTAFATHLKQLKSQKGHRSGVGSEREVIRFEEVALEVGSLFTKIPVEVELKGVACSNADGKIGNDFLKNYAVSFNEKRDQIRLSQ